jgi:hypothetical protein
LIGGAPIGPRRINWNFVANDPALIDQARQRWAAQDWPRVPGETARIELPRYGEDLLHSRDIQTAGARV